VELPFTVVFEPPSQRELRALLRMRGQWVAGGIVALAIGAAYLLANVARADTTVATVVAPLQVASQPAGAEVWVDGHQRGVTPLELSVVPGPHSLALKRPQALEQQYAVDVGSSGATLEAALWRRQPLVSHLRPALPGAVLADARLLSDGALGLSIGLPPGDELEAWRLDPRNGALEQLLPGTPGTRLVFAADGRHLAYLGRDVGPVPSGAGHVYATPVQPTPAAVVWLVSTQADGEQSAATVGWRPPLEPNEHLVDVSWSPDARQLLVVSSLPISGGQALSRAWLLDADGQAARALLSLPSQVVPGTAAWSPDGAYIAFVAHAGQLNAVCLLGADASFRYVADLDASNGPPLEVPGVSWSADSQRLLFVAPHQHVPGSGFDFLRQDAQRSLYVATPDQPLPISLADTRLDQVTWREDGQVLGLWRGAADSPLHVRLSDGRGGADRDLLSLPLQAGAHYAASWDLAHAEVLVATRAQTGGGSTQFWLVRLGLEDGA
jgi:PEGA domain-containing protein